MKKIALILMLCLLAPMSVLKAQTTITIDKDGSNTTISTTNYYPVYTNTSYPYSVSQMIYVESQLIEANGGVVPSGKITNLSFVTADDNTVTGTRQWRIYIKSTTKSVFSSTSDWESIGDGDECFVGNVTLPTGGDVNIALTKHFAYNGGNIIVCVCEDGGATSTSRAKFNRFTPTENGRSIILFGNSSAYNPSYLSTAAKYRYQQSPVLKLTFAAAAKFNLNVNVTNETKPLENATVKITGANSDGNLNIEGKTNSSGQYVSSDLLHPSTCYTVTVSKTGYKTVTEQVCAQDITSDNYTLNVTMEEALEGPASLRTDKNFYRENESVIFYWDKVDKPNVEYYRLYRKSGNQWNMVTTVGSGVTQYTSAGYTYGDYEFCVTAVYQNGESEKGEALTIVKVIAECNVSGNVRNEGGSSLRDVKVVLESADGTSYEMMTDNYGNFTFTNVITGTYRVIASKAGYYDAIKTIDVIKGAGISAGVFYLRVYPSFDCDVVATLNTNGTGIYSDDYVEVTWSGPDASTYTYYNIYRKNIETGEVELISHYTNITNQYYRDNGWSLLEDGRYQYGVSAFTGEFIEVLNEDFNKDGAMPEGWSVVSPYGSEWFMSNSNNTTGSITYAYDDVYASYGFKDPTLYWAGSAGLNGKNYFVTPKINVKDALLSFYYATPFPSGETTPALNVCWSENPTGPWTNVWDADFSYFNWWNTEVDLTNLPERYVYLAFCVNIPDQYAAGTDGKYYRAAVDAVLLRSRVETEVQWSNELEKRTSIVFHNGTGDHNWHNPANWSTNKIPTATDNAQILADAIVFFGNAVTANINITDFGSLTINDGATYKANGSVKVYNNDPARFVINDGAQVYQNNADIKATFNMNIVNPTSWGPDGSDHKGGWQFISSPFIDADVLSYVNPENGDYDLYKYDGKVDTLEWRNYKLHHDELFSDFSDGVDWIIRDDNKDNITWEYATFRLGCDGNYGCMSLVASEAANDYIVSSRKLNIYPESKLRFFVKLHNNDETATPMVLNEGLTVLYSKEESSSSGFTVINTQVSYSTLEWTEVVVDLSSIASTTDDVDAEEAWIAIRYNNPAVPSVNNVLVDNIELANYYDKATPFEKTFLQGRGYMASYESTTEVSMVGTLYHENSFVYNLDYNADDRWENFYLLGNPFPYDVTWGEFAHSGIVPGFAVVNSTSGAYQYDVDVDNTIKAGDGFMVLTTSSNPTLSINATRNANNRRTDYVNVVASDASGSDNLIVSLSGKENAGFFKLENFNKDIASVYVLNYEDMYGIANYDEDVENVDFCFIANKMGYYTISMIPNGDFSSLKLYDRVEDIEIDMLQNKVYKFFALSEDYANESRFVLKYEKKSVESDGTFAYQSGDDIVVNAEGLIQIIDVMGRVVYSGESQGVNNRIDVSGMGNATYVIRNVKNNEVRTQKIVIL